MGCPFGFVMVHATGDHVTLKHWFLQACVVEEILSVKTSAVHVCPGHRNKNAFRKDITCSEWGDNTSRIGLTIQGIGI